MLRSGETGRRPTECGRERGNRPNASKRPAGRDRESNRLERWAPRCAAGVPTGRQSRTARLGERRPARSIWRPRNGTQSTNLRNWSARSVGRGTPNHRRRRRSRHDPCRTRPHRTNVHCDSNAPMPNDRAAHGSPSWPVNNRQATEQRESALNQSSSALGPEIKRSCSFFHECRGRCAACNLPVTNPSRKPRRLLLHNEEL
jgi:hypothetical protein